MKHYDNLPNFWGALFIITLLFGLEFIISAAFFDAGFAFTHGDARTSVITVLANGIIFTAMMHITGLKYADLFHPSANSVSSTVGLLFIPIILVVVGALWWLSAIAYFITSHLPQDEHSLKMLENLISSGLVSFITICVVAPFVEEMLFRGIILRGFLAFYSPNISITLSALLFGLAHFNVYQIPTAFLLGCFLGWIFYRSKSVWPCIIGHAVYNFGVFAAYHIGMGDGYNHLLANALTFTLSASGVWLIHKILRNRPLTESNNCD